MFEACVGNYNEGLEAEKRGANRIELCDNLMEDGTTPSYGTIRKLKESVNIPIMVIIRPRGGDFQYTKEEFELMCYDIALCKELGVQGVVIGALNGSSIDMEGTRLLIERAKPLDITFHMAFDEIKDKYKAIDELVSLGVNRILTKGGMANALDGKDELKKMVEYAKGRISIMPGKGVNVENRDYILNYTGAKEIHGTKVV